MNITNMIGKRFGRLLVKSQFIDNKSKNKIICDCDCGNEKIFYTDNVRRGLTTSCGCLHKERISESSIKHGLVGKRIYNIYHNMIARCYSIKETNESYPRYKGRGIKVCPEWRKDINAFYSWATENGYKENLTIDRKDNDGNYEPLNCHWIPMKDQSKNTSSNRNITFQGETMIMSDWAKKIGIKVGTLHRRLSHGWDVKEALTIPVLSPSQSGAIRNG